MANKTADLFQKNSSGIDTTLSPVSLNSPGITDKSDATTVPSYDENSLFFVTDSKGDLIGATST